MALSKIPSAGFQDNVKFRNIIINGDMSIAQRGTSASVVNSSYVTCDRWKSFLGSLGAFTQSQSTDVPSGQGFAKSLKIDCTTAETSPAVGANFIISQKFEGQNVQYLKYGTSSAESITLSFWVKSNKTGTYIIELDQNGNSKDYSQSYTINSADTWEKKTLTFNGDTSSTLANDNNEQLEVNFWLGAGTNFTSGTLNNAWSSTVNANRAVGQVNLADSTSNEWYITGVQLEAGEVASDFEFLPHDTNALRCLRYYYDTNGSLNTGVSYDTWVGDMTSGQSYYHTIYFPVFMRASPTATATRTNSSGIDTASGISFDTSSNRKGEFYAVSNSSARGYFRFNAKIDAEL